MNKQKEYIYSIALHLRRKKFFDIMLENDKKIVTIGEVESDFISELVLCASFDDQILHYVFALPYELIDQVRAVYIH